MFKETISALTVGAATVSSPASATLDSQDADRTSLLAALSISNDTSPSAPTDTDETRKSNEHPRTESSSLLEALKNQNRKMAAGAERYEAERQEQSQKTPADAAASSDSPTYSTPHAHTAGRWNFNLKNALLSQSQRNATALNDLRAALSERGRQTFSNLGSFIAELESQSRANKDNTTSEIALPAKQKTPAESARCADDQAAESVELSEPPKPPLAEESHHLNPHYVTRAPVSVPALEQSISHPQVKQLGIPFEVALNAVSLGGDGPRVSDWPLHLGDISRVDSKLQELGSQTSQSETGILGSIPMELFIAEDASQMLVRRAYVYQPKNSNSWHVAYTIRRIALPERVHGFSSENLFKDNEVRYIILTNTESLPFPSTTGMKAIRGPLDDLLVPTSDFSPKPTWSHPRTRAEIEFPEPLREIGLQPGAGNSLDLRRQGGVPVYFGQRVAPFR